MNTIDEWAARRALKEKREHEQQRRIDEQREVERKADTDRAILEATKNLTGEIKEKVLKEVYTRRSYANTYRNKNKNRINRLRREREQTPEGVFQKAKRRAKERKQSFKVSLENWNAIWQGCPKIWDDSVQHYRMAWSMRSGDTQKGTQMRRKDTSKPWQVTNMHIIYRNQRIPDHGIVSPWDYKMDRPLLTQEVIDGIAKSKADA